MHQPQSETSKKLSIAGQALADLILPANNKAGAYLATKALNECADEVDAMAAELASLKAELETLKATCAEPSNS